MFRSLCNAVDLAGLWLLLVLGRLGSPIRRTMLTLCVALAGALSMLVGCAGTQPRPYHDLESARQLRPNLADDADQEPWRVPARRVAWQRYASAIVEPVVVYRGDDAQFEDVGEADRTLLAQYMDTRFAQALGQRFAIVDAPGPDTLRIRITLTGAKATSRGISTLTRFDLIGGPYNLVQAARGKEGSFTGSVSYAVEVYDANSQALLDGYVAKRYPNALDIGASLGRLDASRVGIDKGAAALAARLR